MEEEKECMFCLEVYLGRRKNTVLWYAELYPCACRFPSHWQCLLKWQWQCDDVLQCPICRKKVYIEQSETQIILMPDTSRVYYPEPEQKKCFWLLCYTLIAYMFLTGVLIFSGQR